MAITSTLLRDLLYSGGFSQLAPDSNLMNAYQGSGNSYVNFYGQTQQGVLSYPSPPDNGVNDINNLMGIYDDPYRELQERQLAQEQARAVQMTLQQLQAVRQDQYGAQQAEQAQQTFAQGFQEAQARQLRRLAYSLAYSIAPGDEGVTVGAPEPPPAPVERACGARELDLSDGDMHVRLRIAPARVIDL